MPLAELIQWLAHSQKTGTVVVENGRVEKRVYVRDGRIISSSSTVPSEYLGHFLVSHGYLSETELARAMEVQQTSKTLLGKILVTLGIISQEDLESMIRLKAEESIFDLFTWEDGRFRFEDGELPDWRMIPIAMDMSTLVLRGAQRIDETKHVREFIPDHTVVPMVAGELELPEDDPQARLILELVDNERTIEQIALETHSTEFQVGRVIAREVENGAIRIFRPKPARPAAPPPPAPPPSASRSATGRSSRPLAPPPTQASRRERDDSPLAPARRAFRAGDLAGAMGELELLRGAAADSPEVREGISDLERRIREEVAAVGIHPTAIPVRARSNEELTRASLNPKELFLLSRIDGGYDIQTVVRICPVPPLEALVLLRNLLLRGHIRVGAGAEARAR